MTSSTKFSFYDPAVADPPKESPSTDADASSAAVDASVGNIHDETDAIDERDDGADATATASEEPRIKDTRGPSIEEWLEKANTLNSIRKMLKEEVEQDGGEYIILVCVRMHRHLFILTIILLRRTYYYKQQPCLLSSTSLFPPKVKRSTI